MIGSKGIVPVLKFLNEKGEVQYKDFIHFFILSQIRMLGYPPNFVDILLETQNLAGSCQRSISST